MSGEEYNLDTSNQATLNASGNGECFVVPNGTEKWHVTRIAVVTNQAASVTTIPTCGIYLNSVSDANLYDKTYTGSQDSTDADIWLEKGQQLWARWEGGPAGVKGTLSIFGKRILY